MVGANASPCVVVQSTGVGLPKAESLGILLAGKVTGIERGTRLGALIDWDFFLAKRPTSMGKEDLI